MWREGRVRLPAAPPSRRDRQGGRRARPDVGSHRALAGQEGPPRRPQTARRQPDRHRRKRPPGTRRALPRRSAATVDEAEPDHDLGAALRRHQWRVMLRHLSRHETSRQKNQVPEGASAEQGSVVPANTDRFIAQAAKNPIQLVDRRLLRHPHQGIRQSDQ